MKTPRCVHLTIDFNAHAVYYEPLNKWLDDQDDGTERCWFTWVSPEEREKALAMNSIWTCQWYPDTPIGFHALAASSLDVLMRAVNGE